VAANDPQKSVSGDIEGRRVLLVCLPFLILPIGLMLAVTAVRGKSVTVDEFSLLPHGLTMLQTGRFDLDPGIPPLASELSALPLFMGSAAIDDATIKNASSTWELGHHFMQASAATYHETFTAGRIVPLIFLLLNGVLTFGFATRLYGLAGGVLSAAVVACIPDLLAHGALITPDIFLTAGFVGALWAFDEFMRRPGWLSATLLGVALGVSCLAKFTGLVLCVLLPLVLLGFNLVDRWRRVSGTTVGRTWLFMVLTILVTLTVINAGYGFVGACTPLGEFRFDSSLFQALQRRFPESLPVPLPFRFAKSMDTQLAEGGYPAYLLGEFSETGFYHYYLVGLAVKTPIALLILCVLALLCKRSIGRREVPMLIVAAAFVCVFSLSRHKNIGMRYVLFLQPLMAIWIGRIATVWPNSWARSRLAWATLACVVWLWFTALWYWPNYLTYFNELAGGPENGHKFLLDSNLDWGQDLIALREYQDKERIDTLDLAYFGRVDPKIYGIEFTDYFGFGPPSNRYVAISANLLWGRNYIVNGTGQWSHPDAYSAYRQVQPKAVIGNSIYIFDWERKRAVPK
jgi:hypothetical protein